MSAIDSINPLHGIFKSRTFPHARTLRTSFFRKTADAFGFFGGSFSHAGIFDYLTLFIPYLFIRALLSLLDSTSHHLFASLLISVLIILNAALLIPRIIFATVCTLLSLPVIAVVSLVAYFKGKTLRENALDVQGFVSVAYVTGESEKDMPTTLRQFLNDHHCDVSDLEMGYIKPTLNINNEYCYQLFFREKPSFFGFGNYDHLEFRVECPHDLKNIQPSPSLRQINSLFRLNIGNVSGYDERNGRQMVDDMKRLQKML